jgi:hypothetical protein
MKAIGYLYAKIDAMRHYVIYILLLLFCSCGNKKPKNIIEKSDFVDIIVDIHLVDAMATDHTLNKITGNPDSLLLYSSVLSKHHVDREQFDASLKWYTQKPEVLEDIYEQAFAKMNKVSQKWSDELDLFTSGESKILYRTKKYIDTRGDSVQYPDPIFIDLDSVGTFLFDIKIRMLTNDKSENPRIRAVFYNNKENPTDSLVALNYSILKSNFSRDYQYIVPVENKDFTILKIQIPVVDNPSKVYHKNLQLSSLNVSILKEEKKDKK